MTDNTTIKVSGKCETDDIESCIFTIRRVGKAIRAKGYQELADALEGVIGKIDKRKAKVKEEHIYSRGYLPKSIDIYEDTNTIEKHFIAKEACQAKTFRVLKPEPNVLVYFCCAKGDEMKAGRCHPNPTVHKTIVYNEGKHKRDLEHLLEVHPEIPVVKHKVGGTKPSHKEEGVEAREPLTQSLPVVGEEHSVSIPLSCPGTQPISPEVEKALKES